MPSATTRRPERVGQLDRGRDDRQLGAVHLAHEGAVDLDLADREAGDADQRGVAGAEVVDRDAPRPASSSAARTWSAIALSSTAAVSVISSVSAAGGSSWRRSAASTRAGRSGSERLAVARLTRDRQAVPARGGGQRAVEHPVRQRADQRRALDGGQELVRRRSRAPSAAAPRRRATAPVRASTSGWKCRSSSPASSASRTSSTSSRSRPAASEARTLAASASAVRCTAPSSPSAASTTDDGGHVDPLVGGQQRDRGERPRRARRRACGRSRGRGAIRVPARAAARRRAAARPGQSG